MILMTDFKAESKFLKEEMLAAVSRVIDSGWYVLGREVEAFEQSWAEVCGVSNTVGVGNGMDAIEIILRSLQIGPGDEVITTPMTAFATFLGIMRAGAIPVLADIDLETALLDRDTVCLNRINANRFRQKQKPSFLYISMAKCGIWMLGYSFVSQKIFI